MLKIVTSDSGGGQTLWIGLDRDNLDRLPANEPIGIDLAEVGNPNLTRIFILGGETIDSILDDLRAIGVPLPKS